MFTVKADARDPRTRLPAITALNKVCYLGHNLLFAYYYRPLHLRFALASLSSDMGVSFRESDCSAADVSCARKSSSIQSHPGRDCLPGTAIMERSKCSCMFSTLGSAAESDCHTLKHTSKLGQQRLITGQASDNTVNTITFRASRVYIPTPFCVYVADCIPDAEQTTISMKIASQSPTRMPNWVMVRIGRYYFPFREWIAHPARTRSQRPF